ncbi:hypothetical protein IDH09_01895 [Pelagibacterales bacterium SAG-MED28]|nr:hypothetical protein [Pelagibacterales bacterium SAG-MED28]|tara:strand:- start:1097 stop:2866 length:1770 start_codon:yes stop_codon:yes gene_type:complete
MVKIKHNKKKVLGVILARSGSKGIKEKNIKKLGGHPLISYSIYAGLNSKNISKLIVSTDSKKIAKIAKNYGAETPFLRSKVLAKDKVPSKDALRDAVLKAEQIYNTKFEYVIEIPAVAPLRTGKDIDKALNLLFTNKYDSVISFARVFDKHPLRMKRINKKGLVEHYDLKNPENEISRRQDFPKCFIRNGAIYSMKRDSIVNKVTRWGKKIKPYIMNELQSINIDEVTDFYTCEKLIEKGLCNNFPATILDEEFDTKPKIIVKKNRFKYFLNSYPYYMFDLSKKELYLKNINEIHCEIDNYKFINSNIKSKVSAILTPTAGLKKLNSKVLNQFQNLKYLISSSTGLTHLDLKYLADKKIKVISLNSIKDTKTIKASSEFCLLLVLASLRNYKASLEVVKSGNWRNFEKELRSREINNLKFGFLGFGRIGKNVSKVLHNLGGKIHYYDPFVSCINKNFKKINNLQSFLKNLDFLIISAKLNEKTRSILNTKTIHYLKKGIKIVNISRGELIDENVLLQNIKKRKVRSYYTDVVRNEEDILKNKSKVIQFSKNNNNVSVSPHVGGLTYDSELKAINRILFKFFKEYKETNN